MGIELLIEERYYRRLMNLTPRHPAGPNDRQYRKLGGTLFCDCRYAGSLCITMEPIRIKLREDY